MYRIGLLAVELRHGRMRYVDPALATDWMRHLLAQHVEPLQVNTPLTCRIASVDMGSSAQVFVPLTVI